MAVRSGTVASAAAWPALALVVLVGAGPLAGQSFSGPMSGDGPGSWMTAWSHFALTANLPRAPARGVSPPNLFEPAPRIGLFWTRGNPGALPFEMEDGWSEFRATNVSLDGDYRTPTDARSAEVFGLSGLGWKTVGERGAVIGHAISEQRTLSGSPAPSVRPYGSSPFTAADTSMADVRHARTRLEGAGGWRLGPVGLGIGAGYEAHDHRTRDTGVPRFGRAAVPAVSVGLAAPLGPRSLLGAYARWSGFAETANAAAVGGESLIYGTRGYREPISHFVLPGSFFFLRAEHDSRTGGLQAAGVWNALAWTAFVEAGGLRQTRWNDRSEDSPPKDRWSADAVAVGAAAQRSVAGVLWTLNLRWTTLSGEGSLAAGDGPEFTAEEGSVAGSLGARLRPEGPAWSAAARAGLAYETRTRTDDAAEISTDIETLTPSVAATVGWAPAEAALVSAGIGWTSYRTRGSIPLASGEGPGYQRVLAPEIALRASPASAWTMALGVRYAVREDLLLWLRGQRESLSPASGAQAPPLRPSGNRTSTRLDLGVTLLP